MVARVFWVVAMAVARVCSGWLARVLLGGC